MLRSSVMAVLVILFGGAMLVYGLAEAKQAREVLTVSLVIGTLMLAGGSLLLGMSGHRKQ